MYSPTSSLTDPPAHNPIAEGAAWVQNAALGSVATSVAVVAVAAIGLLMLSGRLELRRGITVVMGCFLLFGAARIAAAISGEASIGSQVRVSPERGASEPSSLPQEPAPSPSAYDPYAGASVPARH